MSKLDRSFYARPADIVARDLLGTVLTRAVGNASLQGRIVETEAYTGATDPGSHAFRGPTRRNAVMFGPAGYLYVYFTYGMHHCMNVVTGDDGEAGAVLVRALEPMSGIEVMQRLRNVKSTVELCNGPAKLCQALAVDRSHNGLDLTGTEIWIEDAGGKCDDVVVTTRVGLSRGRDLLLRFFLAHNRYVSRGKPS
ncbi:MAG: DNA-3-methyladenine glycosylase [Chloroflexota bacterium]